MVGDGGLTLTATAQRRTQCQIHQLLECQRKVKTARAAAHGMRDVVEAQEVRAAGDTEPRPDSALRSRLMSKKQLHDMAVGVRELSKRLGSLRLRMNVRSVFVLTKAYDEALVGKARELTAWLLAKERATPYIVYVVLELAMRGAVIANEAENP